MQLVQLCRLKQDGQDGRANRLSLALQLSRNVDHCFVLEGNKTLQEEYGHMVCI
jgi:hypothetical protein